jgi:hypothetical protein
MKKSNSTLGTVRYRPVPKEPTPKSNIARRVNGGSALGSVIRTV